MSVKAAGKPLRVLFVEDSPADVELCRRALSSAGYELDAEVVDSAEDFARRLDTGDYDVILSDFNLPAWTGLEALKELRQRRRNIPFILVTGSLGEETAVESIQLGAADFILKDRLVRLPVAVRRAMEEKVLREERVRAEVDLRVSEARYRELFEDSPVALWIEDFSAVKKEIDALRELSVTDFDCFFSANPDYVVHCAQRIVVLDVNAAGVALFEAPDKETLLGGLPGLFAPDSYDAYQQELLAIAEGRMQMEVESLGLTLKGRLLRVLVRWSVPPGHEGTLDRVIVSIVDLTERVEAEEARREASEKLRAILDASPVAITMLDLQGRVRSWNQGAERIFGWSQSEAFGQPLPFVPADKTQEFESLKARTLAGESLTGLELRRQRKDGSPVDVLLSTAPLFAADGAITGLVAALLDITEQKQLQAQLRQSQKMEAVGRLAGGIAHDFNNLLGVIKGYTEIARGSLPAADPLHRPLGEVERAADRAAALTRQLLAFSRQQVLEPRVLNLNESVEGLHGMFERLLPENIEVSPQLETMLGCVMVDPSQLEQVIMNLVLNARDAMPGGGRLMIETHNVELDETYSRAHLAAPPGPYVLLAVSDTGTGMDAEILAHVFEPFFTTKEQGKGTGLGLATVYGIVKQSGGYVWAYSEPGGGSTFKIYLPRVEDKPKAQEAARTPADLACGTETVLVVEDEEGLRRLAREFLETCGYHVLDARDGIEALEIVRRDSETIHLLLTDVILPRLSGRDLAVQLAALRPSVKVLYMSGYTDRAVLQNGVLEPGLAFLQKPFSLRTLAAKIREVLDA